MKEKKEMDQEAEVQHKQYALMKSEDSAVFLKKNMIRKFMKRFLDGAWKIHIGMKTNNGPTSMMV